MKSPAILLCEHRALWGPALRRMLPDFEIGEVRTLAQCWARLVQAPCQFVVLEATRRNLEDTRLGSGKSTGDGLLERLRAISTRWGRKAAVAVVMRSELRPARWLLREAGAVYIATNALELAPIARIAQRHHHYNESAAQEVDDGLLASEQLSLPW